MSLPFGQGFWKRVSEFAVVNRRAAWIVPTVLFHAMGCAGADGPSQTSIVSERLIRLPPTDHTGGLARETMIVETTGGALFVTGYGTEKPMLWRSDDGGATWREVDVGTAGDGAIGNSDVDLAVAPDGTMYFVVMSRSRARPTSRPSTGRWCACPGSSKQPPLRTDSKRHLPRCASAVRQTRHGVDGNDVSPRWHVLQSDSCDISEAPG
jgi:hypothetical protein